MTNPECNAQATIIFLCNSMTRKDLLDRQHEIRTVCIPEATKHIDADRLILEYYYELTVIQTMLNC